MWPILMQFLRSNAPFLTLPFAAVIGVIGYNLEGYFSDRYTPYNTVMMVEPERTFIMIKPDGVQRGYVGPIIQRFERKGFKLIGIKLTQPSEALLTKHYSALKSKPFFSDLLKYMSSGPVVPMVWEGADAVKSGRQMLGTTNPASSQPGTVCGDLCVDVGRNIVHGSDSIDAARREIALWFSEKELVQWNSAFGDWIYE